MRKLWGRVYFMLNRRRLRMQTNRRNGRPLRHDAGGPPLSIRKLHEIAGGIARGVVVNL